LYLYFNYLAPSKLRQNIVSFLRCNVLPHKFAAKIRVFWIYYPKNQQKMKKFFRLTEQALEVLKTPEVKLQLMCDERRAQVKK